MKTQIIQCVHGAVKCMRVWPERRSDDCIE